MDDVPEMVARAAKAIDDEWNRWMGESDRNSLNPDDIPSEALARAAIAAMREATVPMAEVGSRYTLGDYAPDYVGNAYECWRAMIDAALTSVQQPGS